MRLPVIYICTHDSIGLGEDGPTHQPIEHLALLRAIPNMAVLRPGDATETRGGVADGDGAHATGPTALVLTRQKLPRARPVVVSAAEGARRGGYVLSEDDRGPTDGPPTRS